MYFMQWFVMGLGGDVIDEVILELSRIINGNGGHILGYNLRDQVRNLHFPLNMGRTGKLAILTDIV